MLAADFDSLDFITFQSDSSRSKVSNVKAILLSREVFNSRVALCSLKRVVSRGARYKLTNPFNKRWAFVELDSFIRDSSA